jgi:hypothetical protein
LHPANDKALQKIAGLYLQELYEAALRGLQPDLPADEIARCRRFGGSFRSGCSDDEGTVPVGDAAYSIEELVAELTAAFTLAHLGLSNTPREDHALYIASWLRVLKADKRSIFTAASKAQQATDYLIQRSQSAEVAA